MRLVQNHLERPEPDVRLDGSFCELTAAQPLRVEDIWLDLPADLTCALTFGIQFK